MNPDASPGAKLKELIAEHGQALAYDPDKTLELLQAACPANAGEVQALVTAQRLSVPWELLNAGPAPAQSKIDELLSSLEKGGPMSAEGARWILQTWAFALDVVLPTPETKAEGVAPTSESQDASASQPTASAVGAETTAAAGTPTSYFIVDGANKYGPADVPTLNQWALEGRVHANMRFEEQGTGRVLYAHEVPGLVLPGAPGGPQTGAPGPQMRPEQPYGGRPGPESGGYANPPGPGGYYRAPGMGMVDPALQKSATNALIKAIVSTLCCGCLPLGIVAIVFAALGKTKVDQGDPAGESQVKTAHLIANISIGIGILIGIFYLVMGIIGAMNGSTRSSNF